MNSNQRTYEQSIAVEREIVEDYANRYLAERVLKNYRNRLMKRGQDVGGKGEWMIRELVKKKATYEAHIKVKITKKELDALFEEVV